MQIMYTRCNFSCLKVVNHSDVSQISLLYRQQPTHSISCIKLRFFFKIYVIKIYFESLIKFYSICTFKFILHSNLN